MKNTAQHRVLSFLLVIVSVSVALWLSQADVAVGQTDDVIAYTRAVYSLEQLTNEISRIRALSSKPLGPYPIHTRCTWCSERAWWGFGFCTAETTETWDTTVDFTWTRQSLSRVLEQAQQNAGTFSSSYEPIQAWIDGIPELSTDFDATADIVLAIQDEIKSGIGPNDQQHAKLTQALQELADELDRSASMLQNGTSALAAFLDNQSRYREAIGQAIDGAGRSAQEALANLQEVSKFHHCQGGLEEKYAEINEDFQSSLQEISDAFQELERSSRKAENSLALLLGSVVSSQTELKTVIKSVNAASNDELGSFLQQLHLNAARKQWKALADYVIGNLSSGSKVVESYKKMDFGFNNCNVQWGPLQSGVSEAEMVKLATEANANGFTYHPSLEYGKIMVGDYPEGCKSLANLSWPLYLKAMDFGFNNDGWLIFQQK